MSMHIVGPALSMNGKKKGKVKFRNADEARKARVLDAEWKELQKKWGVELEEKKRKRAMAAEPLTSVYSLKAPPGREATAWHHSGTRHHNQRHRQQGPSFGHGARRGRVRR